MTPASLAAALKARALEDGADLAGLAPAAPLPESSSYRSWLESGRHAGMAYMERGAESRGDVRAWYPEARSVLLCAYSYSDGSPEEVPQGHGRVARYARTPDYHRVLKARMKALLSWLQEASPGADGRVFVDTSPLLERLYARYAGLGWVAKNTMLVSPRLGSYFVLAGLALSVELPPDEPMPDHCGSCSRCLTACPTDAFPEPRVLDSRLCVSYLTIEHRGPIPEGLKPGVGDWVFGCDLCQEACPFNRFAPRGRVLEPVLPPTLPLRELASLSEAEFRERFGKTPVSRAKREGLARNAAAVLENAAAEARA